MASIDQEIDQAIMAQKRWADLDNRMRDLIGSSQEYDKKIFKYSIENQLRYRGNLVRFVINDEYDYYRDLLKYSRDHLMLFPYHLSDFIITGMRITPFQYYLSTVAQIIEQEKSYDTLPNFTAADCLRLLGIGRNQYIDIMNELRSTYRKFLGIGVKRSVRSLLPDKPDKNIPIEPWWLVNAGYITEDDVRSMVSTSERSIIDRLFTHDGLSNQILACHLDETLVRSLYLKGLIYLDVPIYDDDFIVVPPLEGFVMNRVTGDYFETLLYKIFVSIDQSTPVQELAKILEIDIRLVKNAISMYCRLKFAYKRNIYIEMEKCHPSWHEHLRRYQDIGINVGQQISKQSRQLTNFISELASMDDHDHGVEVLDNPTSTSTVETPTILSDQSDVAKPTTPSTMLISSNQQAIGHKKVALFYDSNLAGCLMMGNLSPKLKNHAVTMFEVGKLSDEWIDSLLIELAKIKSDAIEDDGYELKLSYIHALMLHRTIEFIRTDLRLATNLLQTEDDQVENQRVGLDLICVGSLSNLDMESCQRFLRKNYQLCISIAPLSQDVKLNAFASLPHLGPASPLINSLWFRLYIYHITGHGLPSLLLLQGYRLSSLPKVFQESETLLVNSWNRDQPALISTSNALNTINEALIQSPLLIQAYPIQSNHGHFMSNDEKVFVPLPLEDCAIEETISEPSDPKCAKTHLDLSKDPAIVSLSKNLDLKHTCGYITLLKSKKSVENQTHPEQNVAGSRTDPFAATLRSATEETNKERESTIPEMQPARDELTPMTLFDCHFGVPLFDRFLNKQVLNRISSHNLCGPESLQNLLASANELSDKIIKFVHEFQSSRNSVAVDTSNTGDQRHFFTFPETSQFTCPIPRPAKNLLFQEGVLRIFKEGDIDDC